MWVNISIQGDDVEAIKKELDSCSDIHAYEDLDEQLLPRKEEIERLRKLLQTSQLRASEANIEVSKLEGACHRLTDTVAYMASCIAQSPSKEHCENAAINVLSSLVLERQAQIAKVSGVLQVLRKAQEQDKDHNTE